MSDIIKKYELKTDDFIATEEELKLILENTTEDKPKPTCESSPHKAQDLVVIDNKDNHLDTDYNYIRNNLYTITEKSIDALNSLVDIAQQSQHPRAYEVISLMVNTIASAQKDLMTIHKDKKKIESDSASSEKSDVVNNNLFIGNTAQLDEIIANMTKKKLD
ncbi:MAG: hypothetical protein ACK5GV_08495 [Bacteroidota bacterium]|jgi:hypothetical protein